MVAEGVANIIVLVIDVSLVLISLRLLKEYRIDKLHTELFILRDQLFDHAASGKICLLYTSPSPRDGLLSRMPSSA